MALLSTQMRVTAAGVAPPRLVNAPAPAATVKPGSVTTTAVSSAMETALVSTKQYMRPFLARTIVPSGIWLYLASVEAS